MDKFFNNGSMTMTFYILKVHEGLGGHAKDGRNLVTDKSANKTVNWEEKQILIVISLKYFYITPLSMKVKVQWTNTSYV